MNLLLGVYKKITAMLKDEHGATMIEYALMVAFIAAIAFAAVVIVGTATNTLFERVTFP